MSKPKPITEGDLQGIKRSVAAARKKLNDPPVRRARRDATLAGTALVWGYESWAELKTAAPELFKWIRKQMRTRDPVTPVPRPATPLEKFLVDHWAEPKDGFVELVRLKPEALFRLCQKVLGLTKLSRDSLTKTRYRLRLRCIKRQKLDASFVGGRWTFR